MDHAEMVGPVSLAPEASKKYKILAGQQPPTLTHLHLHHQHEEPRDQKLRFLGRISPEEQVDKYLKSVERVNAEKEAKRHRMIR